VASSSGEARPGELPIGIIERVEALEEWREDVEQQAEFMATMTARARAKRNARFRMLGYLLGAFTVIIQGALAIHAFTGG
jgi:hypothetical protein